MKRFTIPLLAVISLATIATISRAQAPKIEDQKNVPTAAQREVIRRGDMVEGIDGLYSTDEETEAITIAMAAPPDDSHKWFISLITLKGCKPCEQLRADFAGCKSLQAWVDTRDYKQSWAHYQVFQWEDQTQAKRWENLQKLGYKLDSFPILIIQPPVAKDSVFGDPRNVVYFRKGYDGNPDALSAEMSEAVKKYAAKEAPRNARFQRARSERVLLAASQIGGYGQKPPVTPVSPLGPPSLEPSIPPTPAPVPEPSPAPTPPATALPWNLLLSVTLPLALQTLLMVWDSYRARLKDQGKKPVFNDAQYQVINGVLHVLANGQLLPVTPAQPPVHSVTAAGLIAPPGYALVPNPPAPKT